MTGPSFRLNSYFDRGTDPSAIDITAAPGTPFALFPVSGSLPGLVQCARLDLVHSPVTIAGTDYPSNERVMFALPPGTLPVGATADLITTEGPGQLSFAGLPVEVLLDGTDAVTFGITPAGRHVLQSLLFHDPAGTDLTDLSAPGQPGPVLRPRRPGRERDPGHHRRPSLRW